MSGTRDLEDKRVKDAVNRLRLRASVRGVAEEDLLHVIEWAAKHHEGQRRRSGEPYIVHPIEVAVLVSDLGGSRSMIWAAMLHDVVEDTPATLDDVTTQFGEEVARLVDGCTKVAIVHPEAGTAEAQSANLRKLFVSVAADPRVVVIKLCDRLHNLRTIHALPPAKAVRIGEETLAIHAPLAHRLGMGALKSELEDRAFAAADPEGYRVLRGRIGTPQHYARLMNLREELAAHLQREGLPAEVSGRVKHLWSALRKSRRHSVDPTTLPDLLGLRVLCTTVEECYSILDAVHALWAPDVSRLRDYINKPKPNSYQSLHTTVTTPAGLTLEVQVRTREMHDIAEQGVAAHHSYKHPDREPQWLTRILELAEDDLSDEEFLAGVRGELDGRKDILVLTPRGDVLELAAGSTPVDFAFAVHTAVGEKCVGAKVDGKAVPLNTALADGQVVEILTGARNGPSLEWLEWVQTAKARSRIRAWHSQQREGQVTKTKDAESRGSHPVAPRRRGRSRRPAADTAREIVIVGLGRCDIKVAGCCQPAVGSDITGIVGRLRITVHSSACPAGAAVLEQSPGKRIEAVWVRHGDSARWLTIDVANRPRALTDIASAVHRVGGEILTTREAGSTMEILVAGRARREREMLTALRMLDVVKSVN
jgi:GTP pyrophosphokinase